MKLWRSPSFGLTETRKWADQSSACLNTAPAISKSSSTRYGLLGQRRTNGAERKGTSMIKPERNAPKWSAIAFLMLVSLIATTFLYSPGTEDIRIWNYWIDEISTYGLIGGFAHGGGAFPHDYPPLAFLILAAVARCADALGTNAFIVLKC